jgi:hypothetical protein
MLWFSWTKVPYCGSAGVSNSFSARGKYGRLAGGWGKSFGSAGVRYNGSVRGEYHTVLRIP